MHRNNPNQRGAQYNRHQLKQAKFQRKEDRCRAQLFSKPKSGNKPTTKTTEISDALLLSAMPFMVLGILSQLGLVKAESIYGTEFVGNFTDFKIDFNAATFPKMADVIMQMCNATTWDLPKADYTDRLGVNCTSTPQFFARLAVKATSNLTASLKECFTAAVNAQCSASPTPTPGPTPDPAPWIPPRSDDDNPVIPIVIAIGALAALCCTILCISKCCNNPGRGYRMM